MSSKMLPLLEKHGWEAVMQNIAKKLNSLSDFVPNYDTKVSFMGVDTTIGEIMDTYTLICEQRRGGKFAPDNINSAMPDGIDLYNWIQLNVPPK